MGTFQGGVAVDPNSGGLVANATLDAYSDVTLATPVTLTFSDTSTATSVQTSVIGAYLPFTTESANQVWLVDAVTGYVNVLWSYEGLSAAATAAQIAAEAAEAAAQAAQAAAEAAVAGGGGTLGPHSHAITDLRKVDGTTALWANILTLLGASDAQAARAAIGAGTGDGTSNLTLGTSATTAAAGNHAHTGTYLTQSEIESLIDASGGGTGNSNVWIWNYESGAWPTIPATVTSAWCDLIIARGPTAPTSGWPSDIPLDYWQPAT